MDWKVIAAFIGIIAGGIKVYEFIISFSKAKKEKAEKEKQKARAILPIIQSHSNVSFSNPDTLEIGLINKGYDCIFKKVIVDTESFRLNCSKKEGQKIAKDEVVMLISLKDQPVNLNLINYKMSFFYTDVEGREYTITGDCKGSRVDFAYPKNTKGEDIF